MANQKTASPAAVFIGIAGALLLLAGLGMAMNNANIGEGWLRGEPDPETNPNVNPDNRLVILTVVWGALSQQGPGKFDFDSSADRELTITYWIDGEQYNVGHPEEKPWNEYLVVPIGTELRLLVEQHGQGGYLLCTMSSNGKTLFPNGYMTRNDAGDCDVQGVVTE